MIYVIENFQKIGLIETFRSIIWNNQFYSVGDMQLVIPATKEYIELCEYGRMLCREQDVTVENGKLVFRNVMVIQEIIYRENDDEGAVIQLIGRSLKSYILHKRIVQGITQMTGKADELLKQVIHDNTMLGGGQIDRFIPGLRFGTFPSIEGNVDIQIEGEALDDLCEKVGKDVGFGWDCYIDGDKYILMFNTGTKRTHSSTNSPVIFSRKLDNLLTMEFDMNFLEYHNSILVQGEAKQGVFNGRVWEYNRRTAYSGLEREEMYLNSDASWTTDSGELTVDQYKNTLKGLGKRDLNMINPYSFTADILPEGIFTMNKDYFLGDIVEIQTEIGINAEARITEIIEAIDTQGSSVVLTFEEWEVI